MRNLVFLLLFVSTYVRSGLANTFTLVNGGVLETAPNTLQNLNGTFGSATTVTKCFVDTYKQGCYVSWKFAPAAGVNPYMTVSFRYIEYPTSNDIVTFRILSTGFMQVGWKNYDPYYDSYSFNYFTNDGVWKYYPNSIFTILAWNGIMNYYVDDTLLLSHDYTGVYTSSRQVGVYVELGSMSTLTITQITGFTSKPIITAAPPTTNPSTALPTTAQPTTVIPTSAATTSVPTTSVVTTGVPTTQTLTTSTPTTSMPSVAPTKAPTSVSTAPSVNLQFKGTVQSPTVFVQQFQSTGMLLLFIQFIASALGFPQSFITNLSVSLLSTLSSSSSTFRSLETGSVYVAFSVTPPSNIIVNFQSTVSLLQNQTANAASSLCANLLSAGLTVDTAYTPASVILGESKSTSMSSTLTPALIALIVIGAIFGVALIGSFVYLVHSLITVAKAGFLPVGLNGVSTAAV